MKQRSRGGKDRNPQGSHKDLKSLQASNVLTSGNGDRVDGGSTSGLTQRKTHSSFDWVSFSEEIQASSKEALCSNRSKALRRLLGFLLRKITGYQDSLSNPRTGEPPGCDMMQMVIAINRILYAAGKESALEEAQELLCDTIDAGAGAG